MSALLQALISIAPPLLVAGQAYRRAKRQGNWSWPRFFGLIGAALAFAGLFLYPLASSRWMRAHPALLFGTLLGGIALFIAAVVLVSRRARPLRADVPCSSPSRFPARRR